jgi:hypothetical protein
MKEGELRALRITIVHNLRGLRKQSGSWNTLGAGNFSRQGAKAPSLEGKDENLYECFSPLISDPTFAAFASLRQRSGHALREIFRDLIAALPRWVLRGAMSSSLSFDCGSMALYTNL